MTKVKLAVSVVLGLLLTVLCLPACATDSGVSSKASPKGSLKWAFGTDGPDSFLGVTSKADGAYGYLLAKRDIYPPFRWEVTGGVVDPEPPAGLGWIATELDATGSSPLQFWLMGAEPSGGGCNVFAANWLNTARQGQQFFADTDSVDFAIEHDGSTVFFEARRTGDLAWTPIWNTTAAGAWMPVHPAVGVIGIDPGVLVGFSGFRVVKSAMPGSPPVQWYGTILDLYTAVDHLTVAMNLANGSNPDPAAALTRVNDALMEFDEALVGIEGLFLKAKAGTPGREEARKLALKAQKGAASAAKKLGAGKAGKSAIKGLLKAIGPALEAADILRNLE
jgi:hypothetical protein